MQSLGLVETVLHTTFIIFHLKRDRVKVFLCSSGTHYIIKFSDLFYDTVAI